MNVTAAFDSGILCPYSFDKNTLTLDLRGKSLFNILVTGTPAKINCIVLLNKDGRWNLLGQGLVVSYDNETFRSASLHKITDEQWEFTLDVPEGTVLLSSRYPYGRDRLDQLICDSTGIPDVRWRFLRNGVRCVPFCEIGDDDPAKMQHFFIAGEDAWETSGSWVADEMVRLLMQDRQLRSRLTGNACIRICPLISPYSAACDYWSYTTLEGKGIYGAAVWENVTPETLLLRNIIEKAIAKGTLGFLMTMHSWQAQQEFSTLETVRTAGAVILSGERASWANRTMEMLNQGVPRGNINLAEKAWKPGLARDYFLSKHNAITFRTEITTHGQGIDEFKQSARKYLENFAMIPDWSPVLA